MTQPYGCIAILAATVGIISLIVLVGILLT
jgi:hypothetical protein